jgi:hypothetical protein
VRKQIIDELRRQTDEAGNALFRFSDAIRREDWDEAWTASSDLYGVAGSLRGVSRFLTEVFQDIKEA